MSAPGVNGVAVAAGCDVCGQALRAGGDCENAVCGVDDRWFGTVRTISTQADEMWAAICRYKYGGESAWATVLGRTLVSFLERHRPEVEGYDLITPSPNYVGPGAGRAFDHTRQIAEAAAGEGPGWPFAFDLVVKTAATDRFLGKSPDERKSIAEGPLRAALSVPDPDRVRDRRILVVDDVYSEGFTLREVARALVGVGAAEVSGIVFVRRKGG